MRANRTVLAVSLGLILSGCAGAPEPAAPPSPAERPTYELGEKWIRNDGIYELTRIENEIYVFSGPAGHEFRLTRDLAVSRVVRPASEINFLYPPILPWPLEVGQRGGSSGMVRVWG